MEAKLIRLRKLRREWHWFNNILEVKYMMSLGWPVASQWCFCSPWMRSGQSPVWRCSWQRVSSWGCSSAQHYWTWQTGCSPDCLNPLGWRWLCSLLGNKQKNKTRYFKGTPIQIWHNGRGESILPTSDSTLMQASTDAFWTGLSQLQW